MNAATQLHSPLADMERAFRLATRAPALLAVDGAEVASDLPERSVPLDELRQLLLHGQARKTAGTATVPLCGR